MKSVVSALLFLSLCGIASAQFAGGSGTVAEPYQVATAEHLNNVRNYMSVHFIQTADIDLGVAPWNVGEGWVPISGAYFSGLYNGGGHTISGLYINRPGTSYQALFANVTGTIKNLNLTGASITGASYVGSLAGYAHDGADIINCSANVSVKGYQYEIGGLVGMLYYGTIDSCSCSGSVEGGNQDTGGLVGVLYGSNMTYCSNSAAVSSATPHTGGLVGSSSEVSTISNSSNSGTITGQGNLTGGLIGQQNNGFITNCHNSGDVNGQGLITGGLVGYTFNNTISLSSNTGNVTGNEYAGGLVGSMYTGSISSCFNSGDVTSVTVAGGIIGQTENVTINNCYSRGDVVSGDGAGGLASTNYGIISNCYSTGEVISPYNCGGFIGTNSGSVSGCYWDILSSGQSSSQGGEGRLSDDMVYPYAANTFAAWDWRIWKPDVTLSLNDGYPVIRDPDEAATQVPEPAVNYGPSDLGLSILPTVTLNWNSGFSPSNTDPPSGFRLYFGTDNPPTNIHNGSDLGYQTIYDPVPDLSLNTTYYWKIVPYNLVGDAANCPVWSFLTYNPAYNLTYPNGGELWLSGTTQTIRWNGANANPASQLFISFDNGSNWTPLTTVDGTKGFYNLQVPSVSSTQCLIKIASQDGTYYDVSNSVFSISTSSSQPKVILTYPSASGIFLSPGAAITITWTRQNVTLVALDLSTDGGNTWAEFATGIDAVSYQWTVSDTPSAACRIRVRNVADAQVLDISNYNFTIARLTLISPNGGEVITGDYSGFGKFNISWESAAVSNVKIEYSFNGGSSWSVVSASVPAAFGLYVWTIPSSPTLNGLIRVSNADFTSIYDVSTAPFTIRNPVKLLTGDGGFITNNTIFNLRWQMQDIDPGALVLLEYSLNSYSWFSMNSVAIPVSNQSYYWYANNIQSSYLYFRIVEEGSGRVLVKTVSPVTVTDMSLILYEPIGGEEYPVSSYQTVSWDCSGPLYLNIYLSTNSGSTWTLLASSVAAGDFAYSWQTPSTPSQHCRILIVDTEHSYLSVQSEADFSVAELISYPPAAPQNFNIGIAGTDVLLSWDPVTLDTAGNPLTPDGYSIYSSQNGVDFNFLVLTGDTQFTDVGAAANSHLFYYVKAVITYRNEADQPVHPTKSRP
jgi:hypothetical protein